MSDAIGAAIMKYHSYTDRRPPTRECGGARSEPASIACARNLPICARMLSKHGGAVHARSLTYLHSAPPQPRTGARAGPTMGQRLLLGRKGVYEVLHAVAVTAVALTLFTSAHERQQATGALTPTTSAHSYKLHDLQHSPGHNVTFEGRGAAGHIASIYSACRMDPVEAACAVGEFYLFLAVMGNSPVAWLVATLVNSITEEQWGAFLPMLNERYGGLVLPLGFLGFGLFLIAYLGHGLLLLPLDLWASPDALDHWRVTRVQVRVSARRRGQLIHF
eukprot:6184066-Pleurochrysis_carterae.AAC.3